MKRRNLFKTTLGALLIPFIPKIATPKKPISMIEVMAPLQNARRSAALWPGLLFSEINLHDTLLMNTHLGLEEFYVAEKTEDKIKLTRITDASESHCLIIKIPKAAGDIRLTGVYKSSSVVGEYDPLPVK